MLNTCTETSFSDRPWSTAIILKSCRNICLAAFWLLSLSCTLWAEGGKEYIYLNGKVIASDSANSCFQFTTTKGFAGIDTATINVCNSAGMTIAFRWEFQAWGMDGTPNGIITPYDDGIITMNALGLSIITIPQNSSPGICRIKSFKYTSGSDTYWHELSEPYPEFTVRPAKPTSFSFIGTNVTSTTGENGTLYSIAVPAVTSEFAGNSQNQIISGEYYRTLPAFPSPAPIEQFPFVMDSGGYFPSNSPCQSGNVLYQFTRAKNQWDNLDDDAWRSLPSTVVYNRTLSCGDFSMSVSPVSSTTYTVAFITNGQFTPPNDVSASEVQINLNVDSLPSGTTGSFSPNPVVLGQSATLMLSTAATGPFTITGSISDSNGYYSKGYLVKTAGASPPPPPPTPTSFEFNSSQGFAGIDTATITVGNGANMTLDYRWKFISWLSPVESEEYQNQYQLDSNGQTTIQIPQNSAPGTIVVTAMKNANSSSWITLNVQYLVRPPKPMADTLLAPPTLQLPGVQVVYSANMKNQLFEINTTLPQNYGEATFTVQLNDANTPDNGGNWMSSTLPCGVLAGAYILNAARNAIDPYYDAWTDNTIFVYGSQIIAPCQ